MGRAVGADAMTCPRCETECEVRWEGAGAVARDTYRDLARAAREHIYAEWNRVDVDVDGAQQDAMQAREDVERLTSLLNPTEGYTDA